MNQVTIMGIPFLHIDQQGFISLLEQDIRQKNKAFVVTGNPEVVMAAQENKKLLALIQRATYVTADGIGIIKASQLLNKPLPGRVTGFDTMMALLKAADKKHYRIYLLGSRKHALDRAAKRISHDYPGAVIVGSHDGYFDWEQNAIAEEIASLKPDIIFVALGFPKQEKWITNNLHQFDRGIFIGVGGSFDVLAGVVQRAPAGWRNRNLEWLYRLIKQPKRWKRMLALPRFVLKVLKQRVKRSP